MSADLQPRFREREWLEDSGFETWTSPSALTYWGFTGALTVAQEAAEKYSGSYSCKATRSDGVTFSSLSSTLFNLPFNSWFYVGVRAKGTEAWVNAVRLRFRNGRTGASWDEATGTWISGGSIYRAAITYDYVVADGWIRIADPSGIAGDSYQVELAGYWNAGQSLFYDAATILGPFAKPIAQVGLGPLTYHGDRFGLGAFH